MSYRVAASSRFGFLFSLALAVSVLGGAPAKAADTLDQGPKIGETIPHPLTARDQNGVARDFQSLKGDRGLVLPFSRSHNW